MPAVVHRSASLSRWLGILVSALLLAGCSGEPEPGTGAAASETTHRLRAGTDVNLTAVVTSVVSGNAPVTVQVTGLVTVSGRVEELSRTALERYGGGPTTARTVRRSRHRGRLRSPLRTGDDRTTQAGYHHRMTRTTVARARGRPGSPSRRRPTEVGSASPHHTNCRAT